MLRICSFNCCSLKKNINLVRELTTSGYDFVFLQETFITEEKLGILGCIDENYDAVGVGATLSEKSLTSMAGRPEGGLAILWKKNSHFKVNKIVLENRAILINIKIHGRDVILVNVYLNSDLWEPSTLNKYLESLSMLQDFINTFYYGAFYIIGDFNADPLSGRAWDNLSNFMHKNSLVCFDVDQLNLDTFTFVGYGNSSSRWLDHIIGENHKDIDVCHIKVLNEINGSDHLPLHFCLNFKGALFPSVEGEFNIEENSEPFVNWNKLNNNDLMYISENVNRILMEICDLPIINCMKIGCRNPEHLKEIDNFYSAIVQSVNEATLKYKTKSIKLNKYKVIPGWNRRVKLLHNIARKKYLYWVENGKMRDTPDHDAMLTTRRDFKKALNECRKNEQREIGDSITQKFSVKNKAQFWKEVKRQKRCTKHAGVIDGNTNNSEIKEIFVQKFLLGQATLDANEETEFTEKLKTAWLMRKKFCLQTSSISLKKIIEKLNFGMGHDGIHSIFLKTASDSFLQFLAHFYNLCYSHCYLPEELLKGNITPIPKDNKNVTESSNYRPVMQSSCLLKIFESHILDILKEKLSIDCRQFGFQSGCSTTDACFLLKEVMYKYAKMKQAGFATFVDLSKAFDRINHFVLGNKLLYSGLPPDIVLIILHYLRNQKANIKWQNYMSLYYYIENGVRQGGVLSPFLFSFYINDIIKEIGDMETGCSYGFCKVNIIAYADDLVLLAASQKDMDALYSMLCTKIAEHNLLINQDKSKCMIFSKLNKFNVNSISLNGDRLEVVKCFKYLGHFISFDFKDSKDVELRLNNFYASFNSVFRDFKVLNKDALLFLFKSYCCPDYGLCLWNNRATFRSSIFRAFNIAYSNALKKICGVPVFASSHLTALNCNQFLLKHLTALTQARYYKRMKSSTNPILRLNIPYFKEGLFMQHVRTILKNDYSVDVNSEDLDVIASRLTWVQRHEDRRGPCGYYGN